MSSDSGTDGELLQNILWRLRRIEDQLGRIEDHVGLPEYRSEIGVPNKRRYPSEGNTGSEPVIPAVPPGPKPRRINPPAALPQLIQPASRRRPDYDVVLVAPPDPPSGIEVDDPEANPIRSPEGETDRLEESSKPEE
jgi:hypothetical protein